MAGSNPHRSSRSRRGSTTRNGARHTQPQGCSCQGAGAPAPPPNPCRGHPNSRQHFCCLRLQCDRQPANICAVIHLHPPRLPPLRHVPCGPAARRSDDRAATTAMRPATRGNLIGAGAALAAFAALSVLTGVFIHSERERNKLLAQYEAERIASGLFLIVAQAMAGAEVDPTLTEPIIRAAHLRCRRPRRADPHRRGAATARSGVAGTGRGSLRIRPRSAQPDAVPSQVATTGPASSSLTEGAAGAASSTATNSSCWRSMPATTSAPSASGWLLRAPARC